MNLLKEHARCLNTVCLHIYSLTFAVIDAGVREV